MVQALIIIDMLKGYVQQAHNGEEILSNQLQLINEFAANKLFVILVTGKKQRKENPVMTRIWGCEFAQEPQQQELYTQLAESPYSIIIEKTEYSAFFQTELETYCTENQIDELYFTGLQLRCVRVL